MRLLRQLLGGYLLSRYLNRRHRRSGYRVGGLPHGRGRVHVTGCCLPIPCGAVVGLAATPLVIHRLRR